jgi:hypothetical protein
MTGSGWAGKSGVGQSPIRAESDLFEATQNVVDDAPRLPAVAQLERSQQRRLLIHLLAATMRSHHLKSILTNPNTASNKLNPWLGFADPAQCSRG